MVRGTTVSPERGSTPQRPGLAGTTDLKHDDKMVNPNWRNILIAKKLQWQADYGLRRMAVFGSAARGQTGPESDLDVLVEFQRPFRFDLLKFISLEQELSAEMGGPVDLVMQSDLKPHVRENALRDAQEL